MSKNSSEIIIRNMREAAIAVSDNAYSPYSGAKVGCSIITTSGDMFVGCNVENCSYGATVCAERNAIFSAVATRGEMRLSIIYVYSEHGWTPCGMCLQVISEFALEDTQVIVGNRQGKEIVYSVKDLFPKSFTPVDLSKIKKNK